MVILQRRARPWEGIPDRAKLLIHISRCRGLVAQGSGRSGDFRFWSQTSRIQWRRLRDRNAVTDCRRPLRRRASGEVLITANMPKSGLEKIGQWPEMAQLSRTGPAGKGVADERPGSVALLLRPCSMGVRRTTAGLGSARDGRLEREEGSAIQGKPPPLEASHCGRLESHQRWTIGGWPSRSGVWAPSGRLCQGVGYPSL
jgi:hypothetical protein